MREFLWKARTLRGDIQGGVIEARHERDVIGQLRRRRLIVLSIRAKSRDVTFPTIGSGVKRKDLVVFSRQFATMINSGLPLIQCLEILGAQVENKHLAKVVQEVSSDIEAGSTLSDALAKHPRVFTSLFINMVAAGEAGGILDKVLFRLADYLEKNNNIRRKVKGALIYPAVVMSIAMCVTVFLLVFVIPTFAQLFESSGLDLPLPTRITVDISGFLMRTWPWLLGALVGLIAIIRRYYRTDRGEYRIDKVLLEVPKIGELIRKASIARFSRTLSTLLSSGVAILDAMEITATTSGNRVVQEAVMNSRSSIASGNTISEPLSRLNVFPPMVVHMIRVGEETGKLDGMLGKIADFYEEEVDVAVETLTSILEPILIVGIGLIVGGMVVSMYMPIFRLATAIGG
jgi:type IV pilus assembly protein PilC